MVSFLSVQLGQPAVCFIVTAVPIGLSGLTRVPIGVLKSWGQIGAVGTLFAPSPDILAAQAPSSQETKTSNVVSFGHHLHFPTGRSGCGAEPMELRARSSP